MEDMIIKYGFTYGPLMIFFLGIGYIMWKWAPPVALAMSNLFRETIAALKASTLALENSTRALNANNEATSNLMLTHDNLKSLWDEMKERIDNFQCPHIPQPSTSSRNVTSLVQPRKKMQNVTR